MRINVPRLIVVDMYENAKNKKVKRFQALDLNVGGPD